MSLVCIENNCILIRYIVCIRRILHHLQNPVRVISLIYFKPEWFTRIYYFRQSSPRNQNRANICIEAQNGLFRENLLPQIQIHI
jgi:hypothetical protein